MFFIKEKKKGFDAVIEEDYAHPNILIIAGPNGAGKSTCARLLLEETMSVHQYVNADDIARSINLHNPESVMYQAGRIMLNLMHDLVAKRENFAFETTLSTKGFAPWFEKIRQEGYKVHLVYLWLPTPDYAIARVKARVRLGGHGIEPHIIRRRYFRSLQNLLHLYRPIVDSWYIYDNSRLTGASLIAHGLATGSFEIKDREIYEAIENGARKNDRK